MQALRCLSFLPRRHVSAQKPAHVRVGRLVGCLASARGFLDAPCRRRSTVLPLLSCCECCRMVLTGFGGTSGVTGGGVHEGLPHVRVVQLDARLLVALPPQHAEQAHNQQHADAHLRVDMLSLSEGCTALGFPCAWAATTCYQH